MTSGPKGPYKKLSPGLYEDAEGNPVVNVAEVLQFLGIPDTPANRREIGTYMRLKIAELMPETEQVYRPPGDPRWRAAP